MGYRRYPPRLGLARLICHFRGHKWLYPTSLPICRCCKTHGHPDQTK